MGIGGVYYKLRSKYGHGLRVAYYRDQVRPQILGCRPITGLDDGRCEIHVLTSQSDWLNLLWALKSFYHFSQRRYLLAIHDDGTLDDQAIEAIERLFPEARLIRRDQADAEVLPTLSGHPRCLEFRRSNHLSPKLFDFRHYLRSERMLLLDSDILFFDEPLALLDRIESADFKLNSFNPQAGAPYTVVPEVLGSELGWPVMSGINSGLALIHRNSISSDLAERVLGIPGIHSIQWRVEQTIYACLSSTWGVELLPDDYFVRLDRGLRESQPVRHYVGPIRQWMYSEGMRALVRKGILSGRLQSS